MDRDLPGLRREPRRRGRPPRRLAFSREVLADAKAERAHVLSAAALGGCQTAPQTTSQTGADNARRGEVSPVDQTGTNERANIVAPTIVLPGALAAADGKPGTLPSITISIGAKADGDLVTSGRQETSTKDEKSSTSMSNPAQTNTIDPAAIAAAAGELLKTAVPGSETATLATAALEAAKAGDGKAAAAKLAAARAAAAKQPTPAAGAVPGGDELDGTKK